MKIDIICSSTEHPIYPWLEGWKKKNKHHSVRLVNSVHELEGGGDILFLISCNEILDRKVLQQYRKALLVHASDLPQGRGWSPYVWELLAGAEEITVSLLEVAEQVDSGKIWKKKSFHVNKTDLHNEIHQKLFNVELSLMDFAVQNIEVVEPIEQNLNKSPTYFKKRTPADSQLDINKTIKDSFNLMRLCDPKRYPAFIYIDGVKFNIYIEKDKDD